MGFFVCKISQIFYKLPIFIQKKSGKPDFFLIFLHLLIYINVFCISKYLFLSQIYLQLKFVELLLINS